jgi:hypothetical protein
MNDLVSEYQQYQDATAEGKFLKIFQICFYKNSFFFLFAEEGEGGEEEGEQEGA